MKEKYIVSVQWGRSCTYHPTSTPYICWDGSLHAENGEIIWLDRINYKFLAWSQAHEVTYPIHDSRLPPALRTVDTWFRWKSDVTPGDPAAMEGIRFEVEGNENTQITIDLVPIKIQFKLGQLLQQEHLRYRVGSKYAGNAVNVYLGKDARRRVSRAQWLRKLEKTGESGYLLMPDDFTNAEGCNYQSTYGVKLEKGATMQARFPVVNYREDAKGLCRLRFQVTGLLEYIDRNAEEKITFTLKIGDYTTEVSRIYTNAVWMPRMEEIYVDVPCSAFRAEENCLEITHTSGNYALLFHRIYVGADRPSLKDRLAKMPPVPAKRSFHVGMENDMLTPDNGDVDEQLEIMHQEELGDYVLFRHRGASGTDEQVRRWSEKVIEYDFLCGACATFRPEAVELLAELTGDRYKGEQAHEISNLAYGWGEADPIEQRIKRTLPDCKESYLNRMRGTKMVGQAIPQQHLDYEAGVEVIMTEIPGVHCSLSLSSHRGAAKAYDKDYWGVHIANHVQKIPLDEDNVRRLFILVAQCWLYGAKEVCDEEVALRYFHDTLYTYCEEFPMAYRKIYQSMYHFCNAISLGEEIVKTGFLHGNYDLLVGGTAAGPYIERPKLWGQFGPETAGWDYDTPEAGWKLIHSFMPGAHLYPVPQEPDDIRIFYSGTPHGQVDLVPITIGAEKLSCYETLILPGWNTMTPELYEQLIAYVRGGGHLILCAAQCSTHITREFLLEKQDFAFIFDGDLSALAGVKVFAPEGTVNTVRFADEEVYTDPGVPGLATELAGASVLASDQDGKPVLVENCIGKGKVWMLTVGEYWGHDNLSALRKVVCDRIVAEHPQAVYISGSDEVEYHRYDCGDFERVVLLNTDWTSQSNGKRVVLHSGQLHIPLTVREGAMRHVLLEKGAAVSFEVPSVIVDDLAVTDSAVTFTLSGSGKAAVQLVTPGKVKKVSTGTYEGDTLTVELGDGWNTCPVEITL